MALKQGGFFLTRIEAAMRWAQKSSLWLYSINTGCCADEVFNSVGCRYDLERFGVVPQVRPEQADLLVVLGVITQKNAPFIRSAYDQMLEPKFVLAVGACACGGGAFGPETNYMSAGELRNILPVDVFVPGCPPRPESIMNGLIRLQEKISGKSHGPGQNIFAN